LKMKEAADQAPLVWAARRGPNSLLTVSSL
jgi:hypothetical protein